VIVYYSKMRLSAIFPLLCALAAFILSLLCLFAGSTRSFLQNGELLTLNTSRLGHTDVFKTSNGNSGFFSSLVNSLEGDINSLLNDVSSDVARALGIHDFYTAHIMDYCDGYYEPNTTVTKQEHPSENVTHCSNRTALFHFDPTAIIESELAPGINLTDIHWPSEIEDATKSVELASKVMFIFYCIGIGFAGLAVIGAVWGVLANGRISASVNFTLDMFAFFTLALASIISTVVIVKAVNAINKYGADIGIAAYKGSTFLGMTWAATALMLLASIVWIAEFCRGRGRHAYKGKGTY